MKLRWSKPLLKHVVDVVEGLRCRSVRVETGDKGMRIVYLDEVGQPLVETDYTPFRIGDSVELRGLDNPVRLEINL